MQALSISDTAIQFFLFLRTNLSIATLATIVSLAVSASTTLAVAYLIDWFIWRRGSQIHELELLFEFKETEKFLKLRWGVSHIRDGTDAVIPRLSEKEKWIARLKNKIIYFKGFEQKRVKIRFYRTLGFQFKCFVELADPKSFDELRIFLEENDYKNVSHGRKDVVKNIERITFIHKDTSKYSIIATPEGFENNFFYPE